MNRKTALETIRVEFATYGKATRTSTRIYVENRIGFAAYTEAARTGLKQYQEAHKDGA